MTKWLKLYATYTFSTSPNLCHRTTLLNPDVPNCYISLEFITIRLWVRHPSVERPPYSEEGTAAQVPKEDQYPTTNKQARMTRARQLLNQYPNLRVNFMLFTDEKLFTVAAPTNSQNDHFYVRPGTRKKNVNKNRLLRMRSTFSKSVGGRSTDGCRTRSLIVINSSFM